MTIQDMRFLTAIREEFGECGFAAVTLATRIPLSDLPTNIQAMMQMATPRDPGRMLGHWLGSRVGWTHRGLTIQRLGRKYGVQHWSFGLPPHVVPADRLMTIEPSGRWYWETIGLWPDENQ